MNTVTAHNEERHFGLSSFALKCIALTTMIIDHCASTFGVFLKYDTYLLLRSIGRLAFPIYCFLLVEGFFHTKDVRKYARNLLVFAFVSEIPFDLGLSLTWFDFAFSHQNVFFTLFLGLVAIYFYDLLRAQKMWYLGLIMVFIIDMLSIELNTDYNSNGIVLIFLFYLLRNESKIAMAAIVGLFLLTWNPINNYAVFALFPILLYNGRRGRLSLKYMFYAAYPVHLMIIGLIAVYYLKL